jgi:prepilin-type N-terminal cleavage/methylation domain-containing protein
MVQTSGNRGFTLVELAVVIVMLGVLATFAVPRYLSSVEKSRAAEAFHYLSRVEAAQERYHSSHGAYASSLADLEGDLPALKYFQTKGIAASDPETLQFHWSQTLSRKGASAGYGPYTVVFTENGFDPEASTVTRYPEINPVSED